MIKLLFSKKTTSTHFAKLKILSLFLIAFFSFIGLKGQASAYVFGASNGTYTALTGATAVTLASGTSPYLDEGYSNGIPIGFNFTFSGTVYTHTHVSTNGWATLGTSATNNTLTGAGLTNSFTSAQYKNLILAPLWDDLAVTANSSDISYLTTGVAGSRVFTLQYKNVMWDYTAAGSVMNFQIQLYEGTNVIKFVYSQGATSINDYSDGASIGISSSTTSYLSVGTTVTVAGATASSSTNTTTIASKPDNNSVFTFTPPAACVTPAARPTALTLGATTATTIAGSFTAASPAPSKYLVVRSTSATAPSPVNGTVYAVAATTLGTGTSVVSNSTALTFTDTGLVSNTRYYYYIYSYNDSCTGAPYYLTTTPLTSNKYTCLAAPASSAGTAVTGSGFTANWAAATGATGYLLDVSTVNNFASFVTGYNGLEVTGTSRAVTGLNPDAVYYYRIRATNATSCASANSTTQTVVTTCDAISSLPWTENFDSMSTIGSGIVPPCWRNVSVTKAWTSANAATDEYNDPKSAPNYMSIAYNNTTASQLWTPTFALSPGTSYDISFYYNTGTALTNVGWTGKLLVNTTKTLAGATELATFVTADQQPSGYVKYSYTYTPVSAANYTFAISVSSTMAPWNLGVDDFRLEQTSSAPATKLAFVNVPTTATSGINLATFFAEARRADNSVDTNFTGNIVITKATGAGAITGTLTKAAVAGVATFDDIQFSAADTYTITATSGSLTSATSGNIVIAANPAKAFFRSNAATGNWNIPASWQTSADGTTNWVTATVAPTSDAAAIEIINGNTITVGAAATGKYVKINKGGVLVLTSSLSVSNASGRDVLVNGTLTMNAGGSLTTILGTAEFFANSIYIHNRNGGTVPTAIWDSTSTVNINGMTTTQPTPSSFGQQFGKVNWNCSGQTNFAVVGSDGAFNPKGLFTVLSTGTQVIRLESGGAGAIYNFDGGLTVSGGVFDVNYNTSGATLEVSLNINGDMNISGSGIIDMHEGNSESTDSGYGSTIYLTGNLNISSSASYPLTATGSSNYGYMFFVGNNPQSYTTTNSGSSRYVDYEVSTTSTLNLLSDLPLYSESTTVYDAFYISGILNLGTHAIKQSAGTLARFQTISGSTVITGNPGGLISAIVVGGTKTYAAGTNYIFNANTTTPFPAGTFGNPATLAFNNANVTSNKTGNLIVSGNVNVSGTSRFALRSATGNDLNLGGTMTIDPNATFDNNGENQITKGTNGAIAINGTFITRDEQGFTGTNTAIPGIVPTLGANSTIVYGKIGDQTVTDFAYKNLTFSGGGRKSTPTINSIVGTVTIKDNNTIVDTFSSTIYHNLGESITNLVMQDASKLIVGTGGTQPKMGGTYTLSPLSTIEFAGTSATEIRVTPTYEKVIVSGSIVKQGGFNLIVNQNTTVTPTGKLTIPSSLDNNTSHVLTAKKGIVIQTQTLPPLSGSIIFENNAQLMQDAGAVNSGDITVHRNMSLTTNRAEYNYLVSPVIGQTMKTIFGDAANVPFVLSYRESNDTFPNAGIGIYIPGKAYAVKEPITSVTLLQQAGFKGTPQNGDVTYILERTDATHGTNLVGNPYPSNIDIKKLYVDAVGKLGQDFKFWDNKANAIRVQQGSGYLGAAYAVFNAAAGTFGTGTAAPGNSVVDPNNPASLPGTKTPNYIVKVGQGFTVKATGAGPLTFKNDLRITDQTAAQFFGKNNDDTVDDRYWLELITPSNIIISNAVVYFEGGDNEFSKDDTQESGTSDALFTFATNNKVVINGRNLFNIDEVLPLGTRHFAAGLHRIQLGDKEGVFANGQNIYLKDLQNGIVTNLSQGSYTFSANAGEMNNRFEIIYKPETVLVTDGNTKESLQVYRNGENFIIKSSQSKISKVEVYEVSGRLLKSIIGNAKEIKIDASELSSGMYILNINRNNEVINKKIIK